jgi:hypothetical protein
MRAEELADMGVELEPDADRFNLNEVKTLNME